MKNINEELKILESKGQLRSIPQIQTKDDCKVCIAGKDYINFASNDYLGLSTKQNLRKEFLEQDTSLMSSASARLLSGTSQEYTELENNLSKLFNKESCLIFNTGYQCNLGVITALCGKGDVIFSDKLNHASIVDGMRLAEGDFIRYKHLDYNHLEELLIKHRPTYKRAIIVSESVFSMDGDITNIDKLIELKNKYDCLLMIDEAHAFCAIGQSLAGLTYQKDVDITTATFGKALGSFGAFCVANSQIISYLVNKSRSFIFSTSIPPINISWTNWLLTEKKEFLITQKNNLEALVSKAHKLIGNTISNSHIIPIIIGSNSATLRISEKLRSEGFYIPAIRPPTVPENTSRLRLSLTADLHIEDIENVMRIIHES